MENLKKIVILAIAVALGIAIFQVVFTIVGFVLAVVLELVVIGLMIYGGIYLYKKYFDQRDN